MRSEGTESAIFDAMRIWILVACTTGCATQSPPPSCAAAVTVDGNALDVTLLPPGGLTSADQIWLELSTHEATEQDVIVAMSGLQVGERLPTDAISIEYRVYPTSGPPTTDLIAMGAQLTGVVAVDTVAALPGDHTTGCFDLTTRSAPVVHASGSFDGVLLAPQPGF